MQGDFTNMRRLSLRKLAHKTVPTWTVDMHEANGGEGGRWAPQVDPNLGHPSPISQCLDSSPGSVIHSSFLLTGILSESSSTGPISGLVKSIQEIQAEFSAAAAWTSLGWCKHSGNDPADRTSAASVPPCLSKSNLKKSFHVKHNYVVTKFETFPLVKDSMTDV